MVESSNYEERQQEELTSSAFYYPENKIEEDGYFSIVSALLPVTEDPGIANLNLNQFIQTDYIPVLDKDLIDNSRFANCHLLPKTLQNLVQRTEIYIQIENFDFKLFQGHDFDFVKRMSHLRFEDH